MRIPGPKVIQLRQALLDAFSPNELSSLLRGNLEIRQSDLTLGEDQSKRVEDVIEYFNRLNQIEMLVNAARESNPNAELLAEFARQLEKSTQTESPSDNQSDLLKGLLKAFDPGEFKDLLLGLDVRLDDIAYGYGKERTFREVMTVAEQEGWLFILVAEALGARPSDPNLQNLFDRLRPNLSADQLALCEGKDESARQQRRSFVHSQRPLDRLLQGHSRELYGMVPTPPPRFQPRLDDMTRLVETVLGDPNKPVTYTDSKRTTVLHGISGVGKSVLAASFARETTTRRAFTGGIFWLAVGETAEPLSLIRQLGQLLSVRLELITDIAAGVSQLQKQLIEKCYLLVLDNAWRVEQIEPFLQVLGQNDRILITSRSSELATAIGAQAVLLESLSEEAALRHLADWTGQQVKDLPTEALELARECGFLPFALALNGAMAADGNRWSDLLDALRSGELDYAEQRFPDYPFPNVLKSVALSVDVLARNEPDSARRYRELAVYLAKDGVPLAAVALFWGYQGGLKERDTRKLVARLDGKGLLRLEGRGDEQYILLHDLQYDFLRGTAESLDGLNEAILKAYQTKTPDDWPSGPNDGYFHEYLVEHLLAAHRPEEVHQLMSLDTTDGRNAWYRAHQGIGKMGWYLNDLVRAWQLAVDRSSNTANGTEGMLINYGLGIKYALMYASINSLVTNIPFALITALKDADVWTLHQATAYARSIPETAGRVYALVALAYSCEESDRNMLLREVVSIAKAEHDDSLYSWLAEALAQVGWINEGLSFARAIGDPSTRAIALGAIMRNIPDEDGRVGILEEALASALDTGEVFRPSAFAAISPYMPEALIRETITRVESMKSPLYRDFILEDLLPQFIRFGKTQEARQRTSAIEDPSSRARALTAILGALSLQERSEVIPQIVDILFRVDEEALNERMDRELERLGAGGAAAAAIRVGSGETSWRVNLLKILLPYLSDVERRDVGNHVLTWPDAMFKLQAIAMIAPQVPAEYRLSLEKEALEITARVGEKEERKWAPIKALTSLLAWVSEEQRPAIMREAFDAVRSAELWIPEDLAPYVPESLIGEALQLARPLSRDNRSKAIEVLVPYLPKALLQTSLDITQFIDDGEDRVRAMASLAPVITANMLGECLEEAYKPEFQDAASSVVEKIAAYLPAELLPRALELARQARSETAIARLAKRFPEPTSTELMRESIALVLATPSAYALDRLAPELPAPLRIDILESLHAAYSNGQLDPYSAADCMTALLPGLPPPFRSFTVDEMLKLVSSHWPDQTSQTVRIRDRGASEILSKIAPELGPSRLQGGFDLARRIPDPYHRAVATCALLPVVDPPSQSQLIRIAAADMDSFTGDSAFGAKHQKEEIFIMAIPYLADKRGALQLTRRISRHRRGDVLEGLVPRLPAELIEEAFQIARDIDHNHSRSKALSALAVRLPSEQQKKGWRDAFQVVLSDFSDVYGFCRTHKDVIREDAVGLAEQAVLVLRMQPRWRALRYISGLAPLIQILGEDTAQVAFTAIEEVGRWWP